jgi:uncharacterized membrane protein YdbT with pleckstrin-like domain
VSDRLARVPDNVLLLGWLTAQRRQRVRRRLLREQGVTEVVVDEVHHHWVIYLPVMLELLGVVALLWLLLFSSTKSGWIVFLLWRWATHFMDVFVVTDLRVLRLTGVLSDNHASTPLTRILDITVQKPALGRLLGYGHFTFESAAQEQGLRDIRYVSKPLERDERIQSLQMKLLTRRRPESGS